MLLKAEGLYVFGPYRLGARERQLLRDGETVSLPPKAFDVLVALVSRAGHLVTKEELLAEVWAGTFIEDANLSYTVSLLRKALGDEGYIETVPKSGYRFIAAVSTETVSAGTVPAETQKGSYKRLNPRWLAGLIGLALLATSAWTLWQARFSRLPEPITIPITSFGGRAYNPRLSPDGKYVTYAWDGRHNETDPVNFDIYVQPVEGGGLQRLTNDPTSEIAPAWSPDSERIAFLYYIGPDKYTIQEISKMGGTKRTLSPPGVFVPNHGIDWSPDGQSIVFTMLPEDYGPRGLALLSPETGRVTQLTLPPIGVGADRFPRFSPDGRTVAFFRSQLGLATGDIYTTPVSGGAVRQVTSGGRQIQGHDWTADGKELVFSSNRGGPWTLWRVAADKPGSDPHPVAGIGADAFFPAIARNGNRLVYGEERVDSDIWRVPVSLGVDGSPASIGAPLVVQNSTRRDASPDVSRDGARLVFVSRRSGDQAIWVSDIDGRNPLQIAAFAGFPANSPRWSPSGTRVAFNASPSGHADIFVVDAQGARRPVPLTSEPPENVTPSWSSDEHWIYFASNRTGRYEVWKVPANGGKATQVTRNGGFDPFESRDGKFIYYTKAMEESEIRRVPVDGGEEAFVVNGPTPRFWGSWALLENGICFVTQEPDRRATAQVQYFDFATKNKVDVGHLDTQALAFSPWFTMTPDGKWILYVKDKPRTADIMLVKNFR